MRETFIDTPLSASAAGNCGRGMSSGTIAENTGQRMASPMPLAKISINNSAGESAPRKMVMASRLDTKATQI